MGNMYLKYVYEFGFRHEWGLIMGHGFSYKKIRNESEIYF